MGEKKLPTWARHMQLNYTMRSKKIYKNIKNCKYIYVYKAKVYDGEKAFISLLPMATIGL